jgi:hypothetical protein
MRTDLNYSIDIRMLFQHLAVSDVDGHITHLRYHCRLRMYNNYAVNYLAGCWA